MPRSPSEQQQQRESSALLKEAEQLKCRAPTLYASRYPCLRPGDGKAKAWPYSLKGLVGARAEVHSSAADRTASLKCTTQTAVQATS